MKTKQNATINIDQEWVDINFATETEVTVYTYSSTSPGSTSTNVCSKLKIHDNLKRDPKNSVISVFYNNSKNCKVMTYVSVPIGTDINITINYSEYDSEIEIWIKA